MCDLTVGIVCYNTKENELDKVLESIFNSSLNLKVYISDNSPTRRLEEYFKQYQEEKLQYIFNDKNGGYGWGQNRVIELIEEKSKYHLVINSDIYFKKGVLEELYDYMEENKDVGNIMPMVKYPDGEIQYLCKQLPTVFDLFLRRFCPIKSLVQKSNYKFEMRETGYNKIMNVPILSGCFMFMRTSILKEIGGFDERYFMYMEDFDLSRRIYEKYKNIFYPNVEIVHAHAKESHKNLKMTLVHMRAAIKYFIKWGI